MNAKKILVILIMAVLLAVGTAVAQEVVQWDQAHKYYGKTVTVEGKIVESYNSGKACFLNFHPDYKKHFTGVIFKSDFYKFPADPENHYLYKTVRVTGQVVEYQGKPEIILKDPSQIVIVGESKAGAKPEVVSWQDADKYYGKVATVEGTIVGTHNTGKVCFLNFHQNWKKYFTGAIFASDLSKFPTSPEVYYKGKKVKITGLVKEYQGKPEIIIKNPGQVEVIDK